MYTRATAEDEGEVIAYKIGLKPPPPAILYNWSFKCDTSVVVPFALYFESIFVLFEPV